MLSDFFSDDQINAAERLIEIIAPSSDLANQHLEQLREFDTTDEEFDQPADLMWIIKDIVDWESGYFVDWKDTESFVQCVTELAERWGAIVTFGTDDPLNEEFLDEIDVPELMFRAHEELATKGLILWNWNTDGDCYSGWITKAESAPVVADIAETLEVDVREGDHSF